MQHAHPRPEPLRKIVSDTPSLIGRVVIDDEHVDLPANSQKPWDQDRYVLSLVERGQDDDHAAAAGHPRRSAFRGRLLGRLNFIRFLDHSKTTLLDSSKSGAGGKPVTDGTV